MKKFISFVLLAGLLLASSGCTVSVLGGDGAFFAEGHPFHWLTNFLEGDDD